MKYGNKHLNFRNSKLTKAIIVLISFFNLYCVKSHEIADSNIHSMSEVEKQDYAIKLLETAKVELRAGNSPKAIKLLIMAREINSWHDDIKDLYLLAIKHYVEIAESLNDCSLINDRLNFLNLIAPDTLTNEKLIKLINKCDFKYTRAGKIDAESIADVKLPHAIKPTTNKKDLKSIESKLDYIIKANNYYPYREVLIEGLKYLSNLQFTINDIDIGTDISDKIEISAQLKYRFKRGNLCENYQKLLGDNNITDSAGELFTCIESMRGGQAHELKFNTPMINRDRFRYIYPLPLPLIFNLKLKYAAHEKNTFHYLAVKIEDTYFISNFANSPGYHTKNTFYATIVNDKGREILPYAFESRAISEFKSLELITGDENIARFNNYIDHFNFEKENFPLLITGIVDNYLFSTFEGYILKFNLPVEEVEGLQSISLVIDVDRMYKLYEAIIKEEEKILKE